VTSHSPHRLWIGAVALAALVLAVSAEPLETMDGLALRLPVPGGEPAELRVGDQPLGQGVIFRATDFRSGESEVAECIAPGQWVFPRLGLSLVTGWAEESDHLRLEASLINTRAAEEPERAITLTMGLSVDPDLPGLTWDDDIRTSRDVEMGEVYQSTMPSLAGAEHFVARYPLACVHGEGWGLALANPIDEPRIERLMLDTERGELAIAWDLGISPVTEHFPGRADVSALVFAVDPAWGFRDAWACFMAMQPDAFTVRQERQGNWMPFTQIDTVERPEDFGFGVHEYHLDVSVDWNERNGVASMIYTEPVVHWLDMPPGMERTYEAFMGHLRSLHTPKANSLITSGCLGPDQIFTHGFFVYPWANGARTPTNPDPEVATTPRAPNNRFDEDWAVIENALGWNGSGLVGCDGAYFDSFEGWDMDELNYRREHWRTVDWPLTFDSEGRLAYPDMFHALEFAAEVARRLHPEGLLTMANTVPYRFVWSTAWLDIMGIETNWGVGEELRPPPRDELDWIRTLTGAKPYCWLQNVPYEQFRGPKVRGYFERCLFYGYYPSFFSHDAANDPYWENPDLYSEDRPVFLRYMSVIRRVGEAGWQPVTHARTDNPAVPVERFGDENPILTFMNASDAPQTAIVTLDRSGWDVYPWIIFDLFTLEVLNREGRLLTFEVSLPPHGATAVVLQGLFDDSLEWAERQARSRLETLRGLIADPSRAGHGDEYIEALWRAEAEQTLMSGLSREPYHLWTDLIASPHAVAGDEIRVSLEAMAVPPNAEVEGQGEMRAELALLRDFSEIARAPTVREGDALAGALPVPGDARPGEILIVRAEILAPVRTVRFAPVRVTEPLEIVGLPRRIVFRGDRRVELTAVSHAASPRPVTIAFAASDNAVVPPETQWVTLPPDEPTVVNFTLRATEDAPHDRASGLVIEIAEGDLTATVPVTVLGTNASLARGDEVVVEVDSAYFGYSADPLTDGVTDTEDVEWSEAAWASGESFTPHWIQIRFPEITEVSEVTVWWALDGGDLWPSAQHTVEVQTADGAWVEVGAIESDASRDLDRHRFDPLQALAVRVIQPAGGGPATRESLMWVREVEVH
jgi:F5/8 type C domain-containing protein